MTRKEREMEQRREEMLKAAKELFLKKGYDALTIKEIAEKAEFSRLTIYSYFKSKIDILIPIIIRGFREDTENYIKNTKDCKSNYEKLKMYGRSQCLFFKKNPGFHLLIVQFRKHSLNKEKISKRNLLLLQESNKNSEEHFSKIIKEGIKNKEFRKDLNIKVSQQYFFKSIFAIVHPFVFNDKLDLSELDLEMEYLLRAFITRNFENKLNKKGD